MNSHRICLMLLAVIILQPVSTLQTYAGLRAVSPKIDGDALNVSTLRRSNWFDHTPNLAQPTGSQDTDWINLFRPADANVISELAQSYIVFQSYRDDNAEIYRVDGDGNSMVRLTNHPGSDVRPRLNFAGTQVVFASDRAGAGYEIYTMNSDGTNVSRLTNNSAVDTMPTWSPDGKTILFASNLSGNFDIYRVDADGSNLQRVVANPLDDLYPAYSPDGQRFAYVSNAGESGTVALAKPDGSYSYFSAGKSIGSYPEYPAWSPDGKSLAYSADVDADGLNELQVTQVDGPYGNAVTLYDPSLTGDALLDVWMGAWSPDGQTLLFSVVQYAIQNNVVSIASTASLRMPVAGGTPTQLPNSVSLDRNLDWHWFDPNPPQSQVLALPEYSGHSEVGVLWSGADTGPMGLWNFDIQYKLGEAGSWTDWLTNTVKTAALFTGQPGTTSYFRSRARDHAGNIEEWPQNFDASTTLYSWKLTGNVHDSRGVMLPASVVTGNPPFVWSAARSKLDPYQVFLSSSSTQQLTATRLHYGSLPAMMLAVDSNQVVNHWLPGSDEYIQNGQFESTTLTPFWTSSNAEATVERAARHSGSYGVRLGGPMEFSKIESLSQFGYPGPGVLAVDAARNLHTVFFNDGNTASSLMYTRKLFGQPWLSATTLLSSYPIPIITQLIADGPNVLDVIGKIGFINGSDSGNYMVHCRIVDSTTDCNSPTVIGQGGYDANPRAQRDGQGGLHLVYFTGTHIAYAYKPAGGNWATPILLAPVKKPGIDSPYPDLFIDRYDTLHLVYRSRDPSFFIDTGAIYYMSRSRGGNWSSASLIGSLSGYSGWAHVVADGQRWVYVHIGNSVLEIDLRQPETSPTRMREIVLTSGWIWWTADLAGTIHMVIGDEYWRKPIDHAWAKMRIPTNAITPNLSPVSPRDGVLDSNGLAYIRLNSDWANVPAYLTQIQLATDRVITLSQVITIPNGLHKPTLSAVYAADDPAVRGTLSVLVADTISQTQVFSNVVAGAEWQHIWADMSAWMGTAITVSFVWQQTHADIQGALDLDEVTLGSWLTPQLMQTSPFHLEVHAPSQTMLISGSNFLSTPTVSLDHTLVIPDVQWLDETSLGVTLPADLPVGIHDLWVTNPGGQEAVLRGALSVGLQHYLPLALKNQ